MLEKAEEKKKRKEKEKQRKPSNWDEVLTTMKENYTTMQCNPIRVWAETWG